MTEASYKNREIDAKFERVHDRFDSQDILLKDISASVKYTNGKLKKVIIAIVLLTGFALGTAGKEVFPVLISLIL